jgi:hypothetical protein
MNPLASFGLLLLPEMFWAQDTLIEVCRNDLSVHDFGLTVVKEKAQFVS